MGTAEHPQSQHARPPVGQVAVEHVGGRAAGQQIFSRMTEQVRVERAAQRAARPGLLAQQPRSPLKRGFGRPRGFHAATMTGVPDDRQTPEDRQTPDDEAPDNRDIG